MKQNSEQPAKPPDPVLPLVYNLMLVATLIAVRLLPLTPFRLPPCPFKVITGIPCPTCGMYRALSALAGGDFRAALAFNPLLILGLSGIPLWLLVVAAAHLRRPPARLSLAPTKQRLLRRLLLTAIITNWIYLIIMGI